MNANALASWQESDLPGNDFESAAEPGGCEELVPFSTIAYQDRPSSWRVTIRGAIYYPEEVTLQKRLLVRLLQRVMKASPEELQGEWFQRRVRYFIARTEGGRRVAVTIGKRRWMLPKKTRRNGQFRGVVRLSDDELRGLSESGDVRDGSLRVAIEATDGRAAAVGYVQLVPRHGWSVISDIDDTIKVSSVTNRKQLLANTFLRPFVAVEGMAEAYRGWMGRGAAFHYVSSSPWQLYTDLARLCRTSQFPAGSFHLRSFRLRDHMLRRVMIIRRGGKIAAIRELLTALPERRFVLVGDSGERDAELYATVARRFPRQVAAILIRQLPERPLEMARASRIFRDVPHARWGLFNGPEELAQWDGLP